VLLAVAIMANVHVVTTSPLARDMLALTKPRITLMTIIVALGNNFKYQNRLTELAKLKDIFSLIPPHKMPDFVKTYLPEVLCGRQNETASVK